MIPPRPERFHPEIPPPGWELRLIDHWRDRPKLTTTPRLQLAHTNGAAKEGSIESALRHSNQWHPGYVGPDITIPTGQVDRDGRAALLLPADRLGIHAYKANPFALGFETADRGYLTDPYPTGSSFTDAQAEALAVGFAYYAWGYDIPLEYPDAWDGTGTACHTEPFGYPWWTKYDGKACPGLTKKSQVRQLILPRARDILTAWTSPPPPPPPPPQEDDDMVYIQRDDEGRWCLGNGLTQTVYEDTSEGTAAVKWAILRAKNAGQPLVSFDDDTNAVNEVTDIAHVHQNGPRVIRSLGRGGTA